MAKKKAKPKNWISCDYIFGPGYVIRLHADGNKRGATVDTPNRHYCTKRGADNAVAAWSKLTGWPVVEK